MAKSTSKHTTVGGTQPQQTSQANAAEAEVQQARHRTTIRIAGIEGIDGFADVLENDDSKQHPEKH